MIPKFSYRHHLASDQSRPDSNLGRLIFSFLWSHQTISEKANTPFNISTITHPSQDTGDYHKAQNGEGVTAFKMLGEGNIEIEKRSDILFEGSEGIIAVADYLSMKHVGPEGDEFYCNKDNFGNKQSRKTMAVMDVNMRLGKESVGFFNCSMHGSRSVSYHHHDEL